MPVVERGRGGALIVGGGGKEVDLGERELSSGLEVSPLSLLSSW